MLCPQSEDKPLDGFMTLKDGKVSVSAAITRNTSRPFSALEIRRTLAVNQCLVCHDRADDQIYGKELDYRALDDVLHHRLLHR
jgi:hypothetical protein